MSTPPSPSDPSPEERAAAFLSAALGASAEMLNKAHLASLQVALFDIEVTGFELGDLAELVKTLSIPEAEIPTPAVRAVASAMQGQVRTLQAAFRAAHAAFVSLTDEGAPA